MRKLKAEHILYMIIALGLVSHVMPYVFHRSLWIDEARLASSIVTRSLGTLTASPLDAGQSAPVGYLYMVKILTMVFGTGETALRLWSLLSFFGCAAVFCQILRKIIGTDRWLFYTAIFVVLPNYIYYGNELKQYMSDCFFVLLAIFLYGLYRKEKLNLRQLSAAYAVLIWFSFAAVFFAAGGMILICMGILIRAFREKEKIRSIWKQAPPCLLVLVSFLANYVLWLSSTSSNAEGQGYWELLRFPLIPTSLLDLKLILQMTKEVLLPFGILGALFLLVALGKVIRCIWKRSISSMDVQILFSTALVLVASFLGFYPIQGRLVLFLSMALFLFAVSMADEILDLLLPGSGDTKAAGFRKAGVWILAALVFVIYLLGDSAYWRPGGIYMVGSEIRANIQYLAEHKTDKDMVYVRNEAIPAFLYEMDYAWGDVDLIYEVPIVKDDYIFGQPTFAYDYEIPYSYEGKTIEEAVRADVELIENYDSVYIYTSHEIAELKEDTQALLDLLRESGTVEVVSCSYETYLYHYVKNGSGS